MLNVNENVIFHRLEIICRNVVSFRTCLNKLQEIHVRQHQRDQACLQYQKSAKKLYRKRFTCSVCKKELDSDYKEEHAKKKYLLEKNVAFTPRHQFKEFSSLHKTA